MPVLGQRLVHAPAHVELAELVRVSVSEVAGLVAYRCEYDATETSTRVQDGLAAAGMVIAVVDHTANAALVGEQLRPTTLVIGGAPLRPKQVTFVGDPMVGITLIQA